MNKILIMAEWSNTSKNEEVYELLTAAEKINKALSEPLDVQLFVIGSDLSGCEVSLVDSVSTAYGLSTKEDFFDTDRLVRTIDRLVEKESVRYVLVSDNVMGRELAGKLAVKWDSGVITDIIDIDTLGDSPLFIRPVYGGKAFAKMRCHTFPAVLAVRPHSHEPVSDSPLKNIVVEDVISIDSNPSIRFIELLLEEDENALDEASIVVSGGRGLGTPDAFEELREIAAMVGGAVGASRAAVDAGWVPASYQVGQTGKMISPNLYVAIGISGAIQHLAGIANAKCVVAINIDPEAPIFKRAEIGVVEDYRKVLPLLKEKLQRLQTA